MFRRTFIALSLPPIPLAARPTLPQYLGDSSLSLLLGLAIVDYIGKPWAWDWALVCLGTPVLMLARAVAVLPLSCCANGLRRSGWGEQRGEGHGGERGGGDRGVDGSSDGSGESGGVAREKSVPAAAQGVMLLAGVRGAVPFALAMSLDDTRSDHTVLRHREKAARLVTSALCVIVATNLLLPPLLGCVLGRVRRSSSSRSSSSRRGEGHTATRTAALLVNDSAAQIQAEQRTAVQQQQQQQQQQQRQRQRGRGAHFLRLLDERLLRPAFGGGPPGTAQQDSEDNSGEE